MIFLPGSFVSSPRCPDSRQTRRLLALAAVYEGMSRGEAAKVGGMDRQTLRDWVHRFNEAGPDGLTNRQHAALSLGRTGGVWGGNGGSLTTLTLVNQLLNDGQIYCQIYCQKQRLLLV